MDIILNFVLSKIPNDLCRNHTKQFFNNLLKVKPWALTMLDSTAKFPVGIRTGNLLRYGNMDECINVNVNGQFGAFTGKHCMVHIPLPTKELPRLEYQWGICVPSTCNANDLKEFLKYVVHLPSNVDDLECHTLNSEKPYQTSEIFTLALIFFLIFLAFLSTLYDHFSTGEKNYLLSSFSLKTNIKFLLDTDAPASPLDFLHGLRAFCLTVVVLAHVYMTQFVVGNFINRSLAFEWLSDWGHVWLTSRGVAVDIFFVIGGLLVSYTFMKNRDRGKKFTWWGYWFHRYMRMGPAMAMMLLFESTLFNRLGSGPGWDAFSKVTQDNCKHVWWRHLLFINNWWGIEQCLEHTWYIAADMQLNLLAPLLLVPLYKWPRIGLTLSFGTLIVAFFVSFGLSMGLEEKVDLFKNIKSETERKLYRGTYNRITPWLIGLILGYYLYKYRHTSIVTSGAKSSTNVCVRLWTFLWCTVLWVTVFGLMFGIMFAVHPFLQPNYPYSAFESAVYLSMSHVIMALATVMGILLTWSGYGGPFYILGTWRFFLPISKLSYSIYLIHLTIVKVRLGDVRSTAYLSDYQLILQGISCLMFAIFTSPSLFLLVEAPFSIIELIIQYKPTTTTKPDTTSLPVSQPRRGAYVNNAFEMAESSNARRSD